MTNLEKQKEFAIDVFAFATPYILNRGLQWAAWTMFHITAISPIVSMIWVAFVFTSLLWKFFGIDESVHRMVAIALGVAFMLTHI